MRPIVLALATALTLSPLTASAEMLRSYAQHFDAIETLSAQFVQHNPDGSIETGQIYIKRPWRMRVDYNQSGQSLVTNQSEVTIFKGKEILKTLPLTSTPLFLLVEPKTSLGRPGAIFDLSRDAAPARITAYDASVPGAGRVVLRYKARGPKVDLLGWQTRSALGWVNDVDLNKVEADIPLSDTLFLPPQSQ